MSTGLDALSRTTAGYTNEYLFVRGDYQIGEDVLPYYSIVMSVEQADRFLVLPSDIVLNPTQPISLEELFQRELDQERIDTKIVPYLRQMNRIKFFNSITVVILPIDPSKQNELADRFPESDEQAPPAPQGDNLTMLSVGPVRIRYVGDSPKVGTISWNPNLARPVVVDGQHRLAALKQLFHTDYAYKLALGRTEVPIILLVLDERAGFKPSDPIGSSMLRTMRSIFVDLNKYAVPVKTARRYLLDDRDLVAVAMRAILSENTGPVGAESVWERSSTTCRLPLALVDWYGERAKFDTGEHLTTVMVLYDLVKTALQLPDFKPDNYEQVDRYLDTLNARLELEGRGDYYRGLRRWRSRSDTDEVPFSLREEDIVECASAFRDVLGLLVVYPIVGLAPYKQLIDRYEEAGIIGGALEQWMALDNSGKRAYVDQEKVDPREIVHDIWSDVKTDNYGFQVVFQKAFISCLVEMDAVRDAIAEQWNLTDSDRAPFVASWIERFNTRLGTELLSKFCWEGAGVVPGGTISYIQASQRAIAGFVTTVMMAPMEEWILENESDHVEPVAKSWLEEKVWGRIVPGRSADQVEGMLTSQSKYWRDQVRRYVNVIRADEDDGKDELALNHAATRLAHLANRLR